MTEPTPVFRQVDAPEFALYDCHIHIGPSDTGQIYYPDLQADEYIRLMRASGIERACMFAPYRDDGYREANRGLLAIAARERRLLPFARLGGIDIPLTEPAPWLLRRKLSRRVRGYRADVADPEELEQYAGIKLLPHLDGLPDRRLLSTIDRLRKPLLVHGGVFSGARFIERSIVRHLRGPVIIAHLGAFPCAEDHLQSAVEVARRNANVYLDTSGAWHTEFIRYAVSKVPDRIIFGSDAPLMHPRVAWEHVRRAVTDDRILEHIGRGAFAEIFGTA